MAVLQGNLGNFKAQIQVSKSAAQFQTYER
jgi:hypothetical protein